MGEERLGRQHRGGARLVQGCLDQHLVGGAGAHAQVLLDVLQLTLQATAL